MLLYFDEVKTFASFSFLGNIINNPKRSPRKFDLSMLPKSNSRAQRTMTITVHRVNRDRFTAYQPGSLIIHRDGLINLYDMIRTK